ncbi:MAG: O-antigen ligase family protein [Elusimicrobia bacterium]|nr:O-antigen ligase family protein [Elusimicrobiota bacterium]
MTGLKKLMPACSPFSLFVVMVVWGLNLGYPMHHLQGVRWTLFGYFLPAYYILTVLPMAGAAALALAFKRQWTKWELFWWLLPLVCLPGILRSGDPLWSTRQCFSWIVRGLIPGGVIFAVAYRRRADRLLLYWIYPVIIAASLLGLSEIFLDYNPLGTDATVPITQTAQPDNPFYRPDEALRVSRSPLGTQGNRIPYASTLVAFLPLGLWLLRYKRHFFWAHLCAIALLSSILLLAQVRSAWVGMLAAMILMHALGLTRNPRGTIKIMAGILLCLGILMAWPRTQHLLLVRLQSFQLSEESIRQRLAVLQTAKVLQDRWLLGVGFGQFPTACKPYFHSTLPWRGTPDNQYLRWAIENGILSFGLLLAFFAGLVRAGWQKIKLMDDPQEADFYKSLLVGWASIAVTFLFFDGFYWGACNMTFWCFLGLFATCLKPPAEGVPA